MKAIAVMTGGTPVAPNVQLVEIPVPEPGPGEVRVRTEASGLNRLDLWVGHGIPGVERPWPRVTGCDGVGRIELAGEGVDPEWIGRRVVMNAAVPVIEPDLPGGLPAGEVFQLVGEHTPGTMAEAFLAPVSNLIEIADHHEAAEAAAFGLAHLTAWRMLVTRAQVRPGEWVLIPGIGGGVALACLGICRSIGCRTIVTSQHQWKLEKATELGADVVLLDEGDDWHRAVRNATGRRGVDVCVESVGKVIHNSCIRSMARGGRLVTCGATSGGDAATDLTRVFWNQLSILGSTMGSMREFREVLRLFELGRLSAVLDGVVRPEDAQSAWSRLEAGDQFGNLVVDWRSPLGER